MNLDTGSRKDFNDNLAIEEFCSTKEYIHRMNLLDLFFKISSQRLGQSPDPSKLEEAHNYYIRREFTSSEPPRSLASFKLFQLIWRSKITRYLNLTHYVYIATKMIMICYFHLQFDKYQNYLIRKTSGAEVRTDKCRIPNELDEVVLAFERHIEDMRQWLEFLGDPWMSSLGGTTINYLIPSWNWFIFYCVVFVGCEFSRWNINQIGFLMNPTAVRCAVQRQLDYLVTKLIKTLTTHRSTCYQSDASSRDVEHDCSREFATEGEYYKWAELRTRGISDKVQIIVHRLDLIQQFLKTDYWNLVNPIVYSVEWLKIISITTYLFLAMVVISAMIFWVVGLIYWQLNEYRAQAQTRLIWIECRNWNPVAVPIHSFHPPEELNPEELESYKDCDGSLLSLIAYGISIESKYFLSSRKILTLVEISLSWPPIVFCSILCLAEFSLGILEKVRWLEQIRGQIAECYEKCLIEHIERDEQQQKQLLELSMAAYLNYSLFLSHYQPFSRTASKFMTQIFSQTIPVLICVYYLSTNYGRVSNLAWHGLLIMYVATLCDFFLICYSLVVRKARQLSKLIIKLSAASSQVNFQSEFVQISLNLWRRQILEDRQLVNIFGLNFFGVGITLSKIVSFNIYLIGLTIIVIQHSRIT